MQIIHIIAIIAGLIVLTSCADDQCSTFKDCKGCIEMKTCSFWYCGSKDKPENGTACKSDHDKTPEDPCPQPFKWLKIQHKGICPQVPTTTTTTSTTTPSTTTKGTITTTNGTITTSTTKVPDTTTSSTKSPDTTTANGTTTSQTPDTPSTLPTTPIPTSNKPQPQPQPVPHTDSDKKLTGWAITGIVLSSVAVVVILIVVAHKKVMKIYRARNPYRTLDE
ncbi:unnamed protein product [Oppiella nova]|uniref:Uncharacterized protein n=1 Tax=Oppiella nova TaxID=334625 RepID=A0A7R9M700_9ACAR|nr:unnamed protein product [Oppiella nova]CAG2171947.1 unnamed protein product [Oppiella nova]